MSFWPEQRRGQLCYFFFKNRLLLNEILFFIFYIIIGWKAVIDVKNHRVCDLNDVWGGG